MKKMIAGLVLVASFAACKQNKSELEKSSPVLVQDTFRMNNNSVLTDKAANQQTYRAPAANRSAAKPTTTSKTYSSSNTATTAQAPVATRKKGWSHRARGAAVGAGAGAITGAIVNKNNRAVGAVVGGVIGAASGYIIGNEVDKKKGR
ncbi:hypothetical protein BH11BAC4_BH11BAC4_24880 [soil metagenome]